MQPGIALQLVGICFFLAVILWSMERQGKKIIFRRLISSKSCGSKALHLGTLGFSDAGKREYTLVIKLPETSLLPRERKNRGGITASSLLSVVEIRPPSSAKADLL